VWDSQREVGHFSIELPLEYNFLRSVNNGGLCISNYNEEEGSVKIVVSSDQDNKFYELEFGNID